MNLGIRRPIVYEQSFPTTPVLDALTRTENPLSNGGKWTQWAFATGDLKDDGANGAYSVAGYGSEAWTNATYDNCEAYVLSPSGGDHNLGCRIPTDHVSGSFVNGYLVNWHSETADPVARLIVLQVYTGTGSGAALGSYDPGAEIPAGAQIGIRAVGSTFYVYYNGTKVITASDSTFTAPGYLGLLTNRTSATGFLTFGGGRFA